MKILGISGSSRIKHTSYILKTLLDETGTGYDLINLKDKSIRPCTNCKACHKTFKCVLNDDMQEIYSMILDADVVVLGSPTYFDNVSGIMKNFMDRCLPFYFSEGLKNKKVVLLAMGGFKSLVEYDEDGNCVWCKNGNECDESVFWAALNVSKYFLNIWEWILSVRRMRFTVTPL